MLKNGLILWSFLGILRISTDQVIGPFLPMMTTQQMPASDTPALEKAPMIQQVVDTAKKVSPPKSRLILAVILSYILSVGLGLAVALLINALYGTPTKPGIITTNSNAWQASVGASIITSFLLGLFLPILIAKRKRVHAVLITLILQFLTMIVLIIIGVSQIPNYQNYFFPSQGVQQIQDLRDVTKGVI